MDQSTDLLLPSYRFNLEHQKTCRRLRKKTKRFDADYAVYSVVEMPTTFKLAMGSSDVAKWKEACDSDIGFLHKKTT